MTKGDISLQTRGIDADTPVTDKVTIWSEKTVARPGGEFKYMGDDGVAFFMRGESAAVIQARHLSTAVTASTANISIVNDLEPGDIVAGVTLAEGDIVAVFGQTDQSENGIYTVTVGGGVRVTIDHDGNSLGNEYKVGDYINVNRTDDDAGRAGYSCFVGSTFGTINTWGVVQHWDVQPDAESDGVFQMCVLQMKTVRKTIPAGPAPAITVDSKFDCSQVVIDLGDADDDLTINLVNTLDAGIHNSTWGRTGIQMRMVIRQGSPLRQVTFTGIEWANGVAPPVMPVGDDVVTIIDLNWSDLFNNFVGTFDTPGAIATAAGNDTEVQFNDGGTLGANANFAYTVGTGLNIADVTASTSTTTGALRVAGGVGIDADTYTKTLTSISDNSAGTGLIRSERTGGFGGFIETYHTSGRSGWNYNGVASAGSDSSGNFIIALGPNGGTPRLRLNGGNGEVEILDTTDATAVGNGALQVAGGASIAKSLFTGNNITMTGAAPTLNVVATSGEEAFIKIGEDFVTPMVLEFKGNGSDKGLHIYGTTPGRATSLLIDRDTNRVLIRDTASSTSTTTGALVVSGGVGVGGAAHIGDALYVNGAAAHNSSVLNIRGDGDVGNNHYTAANVEFGSGKTGNGGQYKAIRLNWKGTGGDPDVTGFEWVQTLSGHQFQNTYGVHIELTGVNDETSSVETYRGGSFRMRVDGQSTQAHTIYGVYADGSDAGTNPNSTSYGIYATASSAAGTAWAGYFDGDVNVNGDLKTQGGRQRKVREEDGNFTLDALDDIVFLDSTLINLTATLPPLADAWDASTSTGRVYVFERINFSANKVTIAGDGTDDIGDVNAIILANPGDKVTLVATSTNWKTINNDTNALAALELDTNYVNPPTQSVPNTPGAPIKIDVFDTSTFNSVGIVEADTVNNNIEIVSVNRSIEFYDLEVSLTADFTNNDNLIMELYRNSVATGIVTGAVGGGAGRLINLNLITEIAVLDGDPPVTYDLRVYNDSAGSKTVTWYVATFKLKRL